MNIQRRSVLMCGLAACLFAPRLSVNADAVTVRRNSKLLLGDTPITLSIVSNGPGLHFFHPHENEQTSHRVALDMVMRSGGTCISLYHGGGRYISFKEGGKQYRCDPNRIFTTEGTRLTLGNAPQHVCDIVNAFAADVVGYVRKGFPPNGVVVGMHNNTPGSYSIHSYGKGGDMEGNAKIVSVNPAVSADDFFITTESRLFEALKFRAYNVALQKTPPQHNDGSFSVFCALKNIPYVNVEAQEAHGGIQAQMLRDLSVIVSSLST